MTITYPAARTNCFAIYFYFFFVLNSFPYFIFPNEMSISSIACYRTISFSLHAFSLFADGLQYNQSA